MTQAANASPPAGSSNGAHDGAANPVMFDPEASRAPQLAAPHGPGTRVAVFSANEVVRHGVVGLLPEEWQGRAAVVSDVRGLEQLIGGSCATAIVDADAAGANDAVAVVCARGGSVVLLLSSAGQVVEPWIREQADAILIRDEVDELVVRIALAAGHLGMRLTSRALPASVSALGTPGGPPLGEQSRRVLALLADGQRDAEMARELNLSESAVRKLVQRTVHAMGARTRCHAVAIAARGDQPK
jgi:DNA-binding NarL/FixJ family response regulator